MLPYELLYQRLRDEEEEFRNKVPEALERKDTLGDDLRRVICLCFNDPAWRKDADEFVLRIPIRYGDADASVVDCFFIQLFWWARVKFIKSQPECPYDDPLLIPDDQKYVFLLYRVIHSQQSELSEKTGIEVEDPMFYRHKDYDLPWSVVTQTLSSPDSFPRMVTDFIFLSPSMTMPAKFFSRFESALSERGSEPLFRNYLFSILFRENAGQGYMFSRFFTPEHFGAKVANEDFENLYPKTCDFIIDNVSEIHDKFGKPGSDYCLQLLCNTRSDYETAIEMAERVFSNPLVKPELPPNFQMADLRPWLFVAHETVRVRKFRQLRQTLPETAAQIVMMHLHGHFTWSSDTFRRVVMNGIMDREFGMRFNRGYGKAVRRYYAAGYYMKEQYHNNQLITSLLKIC